MKKVLFTLLMMAFLCPSAVDAQNKELQKARKKEYKTKMKEYKKEGWKIYGSSRSLDVALLTHYDKLNQSDSNYEIVGIAGAFKSKNVGVQMATNNACNLYATQAGSHVKGRVVSDMAANANDISVEFDKFYAAYERLVEKEIRGELRESFSVIHEKGDGTYEMQVYFIVSEDAASKARIRALENMAKESEAAQKYAEKVSQFVKEGFEPSNK
jgi:Ca2+-binding EF-hand superfamily protein